MSHRIATISEQPELAPVVARWRVDAFFNYPGDLTVEDMTTLILAPTVGPEETFVLFDHDRPVGTAGLVRTDLETRPDLGPWLAGVFVEPAFRGRGYATALTRQVEAFARAASVPVLWLYTANTEPFYARLGWQRVGVEQERGHEVVLMQRLLISGEIGAPRSSVVASR
jgi:GNAT superfamily N-acetyltransferase